MKEVIGIFLLGIIFTILQDKIDLLLSKRIVFVIYSILFCILLYIYKNKEKTKNNIV